MRTKRRSPSRSSTHGRTLHELHRGTYRFLRTPLWLNALVVSSGGGGTLAERATGVAAMLSDYHYSGDSVSPEQTWLYKLSVGRYDSAMPQWVFSLITAERRDHRDALPVADRTVSAHSASLPVACRNVAVMLSDYFYGGTNAAPHF